MCFVSAFLILIGAALGMATVVFQPNDDKTEVPDLNLIVTKDGDVINENSPNEPFIFSKRQKDKTKRKSSGIEETQNIECCAELGQCGSGACPDTGICGDGACPGGACATPTTPEITRQLLTPETSDIEPINFTEEIEKLLIGEDIRFADDEE